MTKHGVCACTQHTKLLLLVTHNHEGISGRIQLGYPATIKPQARGPINHLGVRHCDTLPLLQLTDFLRVHAGFEPDCATARSHEAPRGGREQRGCRLLEQRWARGRPSK